MRYSTLFGKTRKEAPKDIESVNGRLLHRAGFIDQVGAGIYTWLPLGLRVIKRVQDIVREEMNAVDAQEVLMPALHPKECWEQTGRWDNVDVLYKLCSRTEREYALGASHEEIVTPLAKKFIHSYRDLPVAVYQLQTKFRDELRAKGGVLRGREFGMKDAYSFHATREDFEQYYERMLEAYRRVYERCGLQATRVHASGGEFTDNVSDEFHVETPSGEDTLLLCEHCAVGFNIEIAPEDRKCPTCGAALSESRGIEVGNTFDLGTKYSDACDLTFADTDGVEKQVQMGCYGIGITRVVGAIVEAHHDDAGIIWPSGVSPFDVHLVAVLPKDDSARLKIAESAKEIEGLLSGAGVSVLYDDRDTVSTGEKFADADLIGISTRVVVSERSLEAGGVEYKRRDSSESTISAIGGLLQAVRP
ncbi:MAG: aminoacyl--tRNA ligase-related protein [Candidatus Uhrbacteria bacterium]